MSRTDDDAPERPVSEALAHLGTLRRFDPGRPVPDALVQRILRLTTSAPSGYDLQPTRFLVIRDRRNLRRLRDCARGQPVVAEAPVGVVVLGYLHPQRSHLETLIEGQAAAGILTAAEGAFRRGLVASAMQRRDDPVLWATRSAAAAAGVLMVTAAALGVAAVWVEGYDPEALRAVFGVPDDHAIAAIILLGYPSSEGPTPPRLDLDEVAFSEHFGQPWRSAGPA